MNNQQKMFHDFFMAMVAEDNRAEAEATLAAAFQKQDEGTFDAAYMQTIVPKYFALIRPECKEQLRNAMQHFSSKLR